MIAAATSNFQIGAGAAFFFKAASLQHLLGAEILVERAGLDSRQAKLGMAPVADPLDSFAWVCS